ncbi:D-arabinono-1,4-lactone oxidase [Krasilnikoviella flava]|uniref:D-arabinono-1,4-lactone oxidase n=1 Tax=Krasilnikoviella flava TaxID=526729 RepID=UPI001FEA4C64|nr:D-arabinono-1,4-lactone oxidase [Krasilnikoviella flava]
MTPSTVARTPAPATPDAPLRTWGGTHSWQPARRVAPRDEGELGVVVADAAAEGLTVRAMGAGHSFTGAAVTDGVHLSLDHLSGIEAVAPQPDGSSLVTVRAGTRLHDLNRLLAALGLAMRNLGDIDRQSVAGAISTGTHGTGARLGGLPTQVRGVRVVAADGAVRSASDAAAPGSPDRELFELARLGLGAAGVLSAVTLEVVPAFWLRAQEEPWPLDRVLEELDEYVDGNDHAEFYWFPGTRRALTKRNNRATVDEIEAWAAARAGGLGAVRTAGARARALLDEEVLSNGAFEVVNRLAFAAPGLVPRLNAVSARALGAKTYVAPSADVFVTRRRVRFVEMEYALPRAALRGVLDELDAWLRASGEPVPFPVEVRFAAADDVWLSTARGRETAYVAVHQYAPMPHQRYFSAAEQIFVAAGGRPHWGKMHTRTAEGLAAHYPLDDVARVRADVDPGSVFRNAYTDTVLGVAAG